MKMMVVFNRPDQTQTTQRERFVCMEGPIFFYLFTLIFEKNAMSAKLIAAVLAAGLAVVLALLVFEIPAFLS